MFYQSHVLLYKSTVIIEAMPELVTHHPADVRIVERLGEGAVIVAGDWRAGHYCSWERNLIH